MLVCLNSCTSHLEIHLLLLETGEEKLELASVNISCLAEKKKIGKCLKWAAQELRRLSKNKGRYYLKKSLACPQ